MRKERIQAKVKDLVLNEGQLEWLPRNPRQWTKDDLERTMASLERDPDFQEDNPLKVVRMEDGKLLVFAGNLRTIASRKLKWDTFEAILYTPETDEDRETVIRRAMLDNSSFGSWDYDTLANEWVDYPLQDWGVPAWNSEPLDLSGMEVDQASAPGKSDTGFSQISFIFTAADAIVVNGFIEENGKEALVQKIVELCLTAEAK